MKRLLGLAIFLLFVLGVGLYTYLSQRPLDLAALPSLPALPWQTRYEPVTLSGYVDGDKLAFLRDRQVQAILRDRYGLTLNLRSGSSLRLAPGDVEGQDFVWLTSQEALESFRQENRPIVRVESIFSSPLVLYSWDIVAQALENDGVARRAEDGTLGLDLPRFISYLGADRNWQDLGLPQLYGKVRLGVADPARSAGGNQLAGLLAVTLNEGAMLDEAAAERHLPAIIRVFAGAGFLHGHNVELFAQYIQQGPSAYPLIVGYESQLVEYTAENERQLPTLAARTRILYPRPTVWSSHPLVGLNLGAERLFLALLDPEVQRLAWTRHGFRTGLGGTVTVAEGSIPQALGVAPSIEAAAPMPSSRVMQKLSTALSR